MNKKNIIQIVVVVICFGGAGLVLYNGLFKKGSSSPVATTAPGAQTALPGQTAPTAVVGSQNSEVVLPFGPLSKEAFDKVLKRQNFRFGRLSYPKLNPDLDLGIQEENLIPPIEKKQ
jgi:hypothetical protein